MKMSLQTFIAIVALVFGSAVLADSKAHVITGQVVDVTSVSIDVQSGKERSEINTQDIKDVAPKVGDMVTVHYTSGHHHFRADPDNIATKIEINAVRSKK